MCCSPLSRTPSHPHPLITHHTHKPYIIHLFAGTRRVAPTPKSASDGWLCPSRGSWTSWAAGTCWAQMGSRGWLVRGLVGYLVGFMGGQALALAHRATLRVILTHALVSIIIIMVITKRVLLRRLTRSRSGPGSRYSPARPTPDGTGRGSTGLCRGAFPRAQGTGSSGRRSQ